jgi:hypothetical protein
MAATAIGFAGFITANGTPTALAFSLTAEGARCKNSANWFVTSDIAKRQPWANSGEPEEALSVNVSLTYFFNLMEWSFVIAVP